MALAPGWEVGPGGGNMVKNTATGQVVDQKRCLRCGESRPLADFYPRYGEPGKFQSHCRNCHGASVRSWQERNPEKRREIENRFYVKHRRARNIKLRARTYGISSEAIELMFLEQGGKCAFSACARPLDFDAKDRAAAPHLDHDHATGEVRWILCGPCNKALGMARDNPQLLREMASALEARMVPRG